MTEAVIWRADKHACHSDQSPNIGTLVYIVCDLHAGEKSVQAEVEFFASRNNIEVRFNPQVLHKGGQQNIGSQQLHPEISTYCTAESAVSMSLQFSPNWPRRSSYIRRWPPGYLAGFEPQNAAFRIVRTSWGFAQPVRTLPNHQNRTHDLGRCNLRRKVHSGHLLCKYINHAGRRRGRRGGVRCCAVIMWCLIYFHASMSFLV